MGTISLLCGAQMTAKIHLERSHLHHLLRQMIRIRHFESKCVELYQAQKILGFLHLYDGEEAVSVGVTEALGPGDAVVATYREHGQAIARGIGMDRLMAEMLGKQEGCCRGRGGSMHIFDRATRFYGGNAIVGGGLPLAVGVALGDEMRGTGAVTACFFGDGAVDEGEFHESMNLASLWSLPVLFVCENNLYAMGMALERAGAETELFRKAAAYRMAGSAVDGMDIIAIETAARAAIEQIRGGNGPRFLECRTYRFRAHSMYDAQLYRTKKEVETWRKKGPIVRFESWLRDNGLIHDDDIRRIEADADAEINAAVAFAEAGTPEPIEELERFVTMDAVPT
jgi:pyruvate dehydrogenase E1 component alpha subunit